MPEEEVGLIVKYFAKPGVAALEIRNGSIRTGDLLRFKGHTTDFTQEVSSMEVDNKPIDEAGAGDLVGIKVKERVREKDRVYRVEG